MVICYAAQKTNTDSDLGFLGLPKKGEVYYSFFLLIHNKQLDKV